MIDVNINNVKEFHVEPAQSVDDDYSSFQAPPRLTVNEVTPEGLMTTNYLDLAGSITVMRVDDNGNPL